MTSYLLALELHIHASFGGAMQRKRHLLYSMQRLAMFVSFCSVALGQGFWSSKPEAIALEEIPANLRRTPPTRVHPKPKEGREPGWLHTARSTGAGYEKMVRGLCSGEAACRAQLSKPVATIHAAAIAAFEANSAAFHAARYDAKKLVRELPLEHFPQRNNWIGADLKLETPTPGLFVVTVPDRQPRPGAQAVAVIRKPGTGVSFVLLGKRSEPRYRFENVPHEVSHVVYRMARHLGAIPVPNAKLFTFVDEVLARGTGGERPMGYPPQDATEADLQRTGELNGLLIDGFESAADRAVPDARHTLMGVALSAGSMGEFRSSLDAYHEWLEKRPVKPSQRSQATGGGWTIIP